MVANKAGKHFDNLSDCFTQSRGLDLILTNLQNEELRLQVLNNILVLIENDELVCVKVLKLKVISNIIRHFVIMDNKDEPVSLKEEKLHSKSCKLIYQMLDQIQRNKHWDTLLKNSEQFKPEKVRLIELADDQEVPSHFRDKL